MRELASQKNGKCLSSQYVNFRTKLKWECAVGHCWWAIPGNIMNGKWCPYCSHHHSDAKEHMKELVRIASQKGGKCLSPIYINARTPLEWQCSDGHQWFSAPMNIKRGRWCHSCFKSKYLTEQKCRYIFQSIFGKKFPTRRMGKIELDGYNKELNIAFEYNGKQHYVPSKYFKNFSLQKRQQIDRQKRNTCLDLDITLIIIPYWEAKTDDNLIRYISSNLTPTPEINIKMIDFYTNLSVMKELKSIATERGGELLSTVYKGMHHKLWWKCCCGHKWKTTPSSIKHSGTWCKKCHHLDRRKNSAKQTA